MLVSQMVPSSPHGLHFELHTLVATPPAAETSPARLMSDDANSTAFVPRVTRAVRTPFVDIAAPAHIEMRPPPPPVYEWLSSLAYASPPSTDMTDPTEDVTVSPYRKTVPPAPPVVPFLLLHSDPLPPFAETSPSIVMAPLARTSMTPPPFPPW